MKTYWGNLNQRERWMLGCGGVFVAFSLVYVLLFAPLINAIHDKSQQRIEKQQTLAWLQSVRLQHKKTTVAKVVSHGQLLSVLAEKLKSASFHRFPYQLEQTGAGDIQLSFVNVPYNAFMTWLWSARQQFTFSIKQLTVEHTDTPGVVKLMVIVSVHDKKISVIPAQAGNYP